MQAVIIVAIDTNGIKVLYNELNWMPTDAIFKLTGFRFFKWESTSANK